MHQEAVVLVNEEGVVDTQPRRDGSCQEVTPIWRPAARDAVLYPTVVSRHKGLIHVCVCFDAGLASARASSISGIKHTFITFNHSIDGDKKLFSSLLAHGIAKPG